MDRRDLLLLLPQPVRRLPADLAAVLALTLATLAAVFVPGLNETPVRVVFGLVFVLFLPGYAFVAALFPEAGESPSTDQEGGDADGEAPTKSSAADETDRSSDAPAPVPGSKAAEAEQSETDSGFDVSAGGRSGIDGIERVALSFGLSIAIVPLIGLVLNFTPWGIRLVPIAVSVSLFTAGSVVVAAVRRWELPPEERFAVPYHDWIAAGKAELFDPDDRVDAGLNVLLGLSILLAVGSVGYAVAVPQDGEQFTEFYILTENEDGELVADGYPQELVVGEATELVVGIGNQEHETTSYSVVIQLQKVETANNETTVRRRDEIDRFSTRLDHNETRHTYRTITPTFAGEDLRIKFLLFRGEPPSSPTAENAYRDLHLWVDVAEA